MLDRDSTRRGCLFGKVCIFLLYTFMTVTRAHVIHSRDLIEDHLFAGMVLVYVAFRALICSDIIVCAPPARVVVSLISGSEAEPLRMISRKILLVHLYPLNIDESLCVLTADPIK